MKTSNCKSLHGFDIGCNMLGVALEIFLLYKTIISSYGILVLVNNCESLQEFLELIFITYME